VCTLAVFHAVFADAPLVVAANRDEFLDRPACAPGLLRTQPPRVFGGRDLQAGGTWLGLGEGGLVAGVLNRRSPTPPDPACRSRGQLCLGLLGCETAAEAAARLAALPAGGYNPFNLLVADAREAFIASQRPGEAPRLMPLSAGLHVVTNLDVNDPTCPRIAHSRQLFAAAGAPFGGDGDTEGFVGRLRSVLADHATAADPRGPGSLCVHRGPYGTRSASVVIVGAGGQPLLYFHAEGAPCETRLERVPLPF